MVYDVVFSDRASNEISLILQYIEDNWSAKIAQDFAVKIDKKIEFIKSNPYQYPSFKNKIQIRRCVVSEHVSFFYRILNDEFK